MSNVGGVGAPHTPGSGKQRAVVHAPPPVPRAAPVAAAALVAKPVVPAALTRRGVELPVAHLTNAEIERWTARFTLEAPVPAHLKRNGRTPKPEQVQVVHLDVPGRRLILPRWEGANALITEGRAVTRPAAPAMPAVAPVQAATTQPPACTIAAAGNQQLIIEHLMNGRLGPQARALGLATAVLQAKTGCGKTYIGALVAHRVAALGLRPTTNGMCLWVVPNTAILEQTLVVLKAAFPDQKIGQWHGKKHDDVSTSFITLAVINSLMSMVKTNQQAAAQWASQFVLTIYDEVHMYLGEVNAQVFWHFSSPVTLAMSATVEENRRDMDKIYTMHFGPVVYADKIPGFEGSELPWMGQVDVVKYSGPPDYTAPIYNPGTGTIMYSAMTDQLSRDPARNTLIIEWARRLLLENHSVYVFVFNRSHAATLAELFIKSATDGEMSITDIKQNDVVADADMGDVGDMGDADEISDGPANAAPPSTGGESSRAVPIATQCSVVLRGGATRDQLNAAYTNASIIFTTYGYSAVGVSITRMTAIVLAIPRRSGLQQIVGRIERRGSDVNVPRRVVDIVDDKISLRSQYPDRRHVYDAKGYVLVHHK